MVSSAASCSLAFILWGKGFLLDQLHYAKTKLLDGLVSKYNMSIMLLFCQLYNFHLYQRILTLPEDILFWKAYQDALLSIALSHPLHRKASKSPWIFFYRYETVVFCIINRKLLTSYINSIMITCSFTE